MVSGITVLHDDGYWLFLTRLYRVVTRYLLSGGPAAVCPAVIGHLVSLQQRLDSWSPCISIVHIISHLVSLEHCPVAHIFGYLVSFNL